MNLRFLTAGESHGPALTGILEGVPAGLPLDASVIDPELARRQKGFGAGGRMKIEHDHVQILGGVMGGQTTGAPLAFLLENADHTKWKGQSVPPMTAPRPGHADLTGAVKYGYSDLRPSLERASARETAMRVVIGAVCKHLLAQFGIRVGGYVTAIGEVTAQLTACFQERFEAAEASDVRCPDPIAAEAMHAHIWQHIQNKDTLGGIIEVIGLHLPPGLAAFTQWDTRLEARLAQAVMSIQSVKGIEIGDAFANTRRPGTQAHDAFALDGASIQRASNRAGGLEAGITNGQPLVIRAALKPIATTLTAQQTIDLHTGKEMPTRYERSDFCHVPRAVPVVEAMVAFVLADALLEKLGGDSLDEIKPRFASLRRDTLHDLAMDGEAHVWW